MDGDTALYACKVCGKMVYDPNGHCWPAVGDKGVVKCSDLEWRTAICKDGPKGLVWEFIADGRTRYVDTSVARKV